MRTHTLPTTGPDLFLLKVAGFRIRSRLLLALSSAMLPLTAAADTVSAMHDALKERWYTTEIVVFRTTNPPADEEFLLSGERLSEAQQAALERRSGRDPVFETETDPSAEDDEDNADAADSEASFNADKPASFLTANTSAEATEPGLETQLRPALDAEPWESIKGYDASDDLGELVARNMATWESQLRARDGQWLGDEELTLTEAVEKLRSSADIEILLHSGWTQSVPPRDAGKPIHVEAGETYIENRTGEQRFSLTGEITVTLGRYLHVQPTLFYTAPSFQADTDGALPQSDLIDPPTRWGPAVRDLSSSSDEPGRSALDRLRDRETVERFGDQNTQNRNLQGGEIDFEQELPPYIRLDQSRRMRSGELHYIDHPELGVLVRITPVVATELLQEQFALLQ